MNHNSRVYPLYQPARTLQSPLFGAIPRLLFKFLWQIDDLSECGLLAWVYLFSIFSPLLCIWFLISSWAVALACDIVGCGHSWEGTHQWLDSVSTVFICVPSDVTRTAGNSGLLLSLSGSPALSLMLLVLGKSEVCFAGHLLCLYPTFASFPVEHQCGHFVQKVGAR